MVGVRDLKFLKKYASSEEEERNISQRCDTKMWKRETESWVGMEGVGCWTRRASSVEWNLRLCSEDNH